MPPASAHTYNHSTAPARLSPERAVLSSSPSTPQTAVPMTTSQSPPHEPALQQTKANLKAWWNHFRFAQQVKKEAEEKKGA